MKIILLTALLITFPVAQSTLMARVFEDQFGRIINAELVSHTGNESENVTIKKSGKKMVVKVSLFSEKDQKFIRDWILKLLHHLTTTLEFKSPKKILKTSPVVVPSRSQMIKELLTS